MACGQRRGTCPRGQLGSSTQGPAARSSPAPLLHGRPRRRRCSSGSCRAPRPVCWRFAAAVARRDSGRRGRRNRLRRRERGVAVVRMPPRVCALARRRRRAVVDTAPAPSSDERRRRRCRAPDRRRRRPRHRAAGRHARRTPRRRFRCRWPPAAGQALHQWHHIVIVAVAGRRPSGRRRGRPGEGGRRRGAVVVERRHVVRVEVDLLPDQRLVLRRRLVDGRLRLLGGGAHGREAGSQAGSLLSSFSSGVAPSTRARHGGSCRAALQPSATA